MTEARSKRRVLPLFFIVKSFKKPLLICTKLPLNWRKPEIIITIIKTLLDNTITENSVFYIVVN